MARSLKVGATFPPIRGQASDANGNPVDLSTAMALTMIAISATHTISGPATALQPPVADPDGVHQWNWEYDIQVGDTTVAGSYNLYLRADWTTTQIEYFPDDGSEKLTIEPVS